MTTVFKASNEASSRLNRIADILGSRGPTTLTAAFGQPPKAEPEITPWAFDHK